MKLLKTTAGLSMLVTSALLAGQALAFDLGIVAFQMSSETHARCANAAEARAAELGWDVQVLNSNGSLQTHSEQIENLILAAPDAILVCMSKPIEADAQFAAAKEAGIPVVSVVSGSSPHTLFDVQVNEYGVGAESALYLLGTINFEGGILVQRFEANAGTRIRGAVLSAVLAENPAVTVVGEHSMARTKSWRDDVRNGMQALILQQAGKFKGVWASFDGQAFIIDDLLKEAGLNKGDVSLVSIDGGQEVFQRILDPQSMMTATVSIPFEEMAIAAVDAMKAIVVDGKAKEEIVKGPYMFMPAILVDANNAADYID
ncbi:sugar ABC transporter substrate-binding protein [Pseudorhodobacter turbinis]|uniref:Sugar ABC transporter substrate-binding protein n=1 Tax=Pseudorhodobacter turbinis TaxID=2500533 RepID=A0A4P8ECZ8_9RHOB|nr:substrate-binding domain-containing protein [Pseudorhodobacter turbinis]QCO54588.1 sugar ABC transporter substrate-binding protein [Pseudorhodobacter turbinis]